MTRTRRFSLLAALIFLATGAAIACTERTPLSSPPPVAPPPPPPTSLTVSLVNHLLDDGAIFVELRGPTIQSAASADSTRRFFTEMVGDTLLRAIIVGPLTDTPLMTVSVGPGASASSYHATIVEVADRAGQLRSDLSSHSITIEVR